MCPFYVRYLCLSITNQASSAQCHHYLAGRHIRNYASYGYTVSEHAHVIDTLGHVFDREGRSRSNLCNALIQ